MLRRIRGGGLLLISATASLFSMEDAVKWIHAKQDNTFIGISSKYKHYYPTLWQNNDSLYSSQSEALSLECKMEDVGSLRDLIDNAHIYKDPILQEKSYKDAISKYSFNQALKLLTIAHTLQSSPAQEELALAVVKKVLNLIKKGQKPKTFKKSRSQQLPVFLESVIRLPPQIKAYLSKQNILNHTATAVILQEVLPKEAQVWGTSHKKLKINCLAFHPRNNVLAIGCKNKGACIWDLKSNKAVCWSIEEKGTVKAIAFNKSGNYLALGHQDGNLTVYDTLNNSLFYEYRLEGAIKSLSWCPIGNIVAIGTNKGINIRDLNNDKTLEIGRDMANLATFCPRSDVLLFAIAGTYLQLYTYAIDAETKVFMLGSRIPITKKVFSLRESIRRTKGNSFRVKWDNQPFMDLPIKKLFFNEEASSLELIISNIQAIEIYKGHINSLNEVIYFDKHRLLKYPQVVPPLFIINSYAQIKGYIVPTDKKEIKEIQLCDRNTNKCIWSQKILHPLKAMITSRDGSFLAAVGPNKEVIVYQFPSLKKIRKEIAQFNLETKLFLCMLKENKNDFNGPIKTENSVLKNIEVPLKWQRVIQELLTQAHLKLNLK